MKRDNIKHILILNMIGILLITVLFVSCEKDQHTKPVPGPFEVTHQLPDIVPAEGGNYTLTIDASTNGWWIEIPDNTGWVTINRRYGSARVTQDIVVQSNGSGQEREVSFEVKGTNQQTIIIQIKQQD